MNDLYNIVSDLNKDKEYSLPEWAEEILLPEEGQILSDLVSLKSELISLNQKIETKEAQLSALNRKKILFTESGDLLETEVETIFRDLGLGI